MGDMAQEPNGLTERERIDWTLAYPLAYPTTATSLAATWAVDLIADLRIRADLRAENERLKREVFRWSRSVAASAVMIDWLGAEPNSVADKSEHKRLMWLIGLDYEDAAGCRAGWPNGTQGE